MRILAISDIHGQVDKLNKLLEKVHYNAKEDKLIILGDIVDRGRQNVATVKRVMELQKEGATVIKGNHDLMAQATLGELYNDSPLSDTKLHIQCGGGNTYMEFVKLDKETQLNFYKFFASLPIYYEVDKYIFVHAGVNSAVPVSHNSDDILLWEREPFLSNRAYKEKIVVFGHTPTYHMTTGSFGRIEDCRIWIDPVFEDKIGIDCGAVFGGKLACLELPSYKGYYV